MLHNPPKTSTLTPITVFKAQKHPFILDASPFPFLTGLFLLTLLIPLTFSLHGVSLLLGGLIRMLWQAQKILSLITYRVKSFCKYSRLVAKQTGAARVLVKAYPFLPLVLTASPQEPPVGWGAWAYSSIPSAPVTAAIVGGAAVVVLVIFFGPAGGGGGALIGKTFFAGTAAASTAAATTGTTVATVSTSVLATAATGTATSSAATAVAVISTTAKVIAPVAIVTTGVVAALASAPTVPTLPAPILALAEASSSAPAFTPVLPKAITTVVKLHAQQEFLDPEALAAAITELTHDLAQLPPEVLGAIGTVAAAFVRVNAFVLAVDGFCLQAQYCQVTVAEGERLLRALENTKLKACNDGFTSAWFGLWFKVNPFTTPAISKFIYFLSHLKEHHVVVNKLVTTIQAMR